METIEDVLMVTTVMEHSRFFCYMAKQIESHKGITNIRTVEKGKRQILRLPLNLTPLL